MTVRGTLAFVALISAAFSPIGATSFAQADGSVAEVSDLEPLSDQALVLDAYGVDRNIIVVGERGHVLLGHGGSSEWRQVQVPTRRMLCAVAGSGEGIWAVGHDAVIIHSDDGGENWTEQYSAPEDEAPLFDLWVEDTQHVLAVGAYGLSLETFDGGMTWERRTLLAENDSHLYDIAESSNGVLYIASEFGLILRSNDRGQSWEETSSPYGGSFFGILPLADESVLVFGLRGHLFRSTDRGSTWASLKTATTESLLGGVQRANGDVLIVGLSGCSLLSQDGGQSFLTSFRGDRAALSSAREFVGQVLLLGEDGIEWLVESDLVSASTH